MNLQTLSHRKNKGDIVTLEIRGLGSEGEGVGEEEGYVLFVEGALPGERVEAELLVCKKRHGIAKLRKILRPSPDRVSPPCPLFGRCGGCQLMHLSYPKQLEVKRQRVIDALERIGKIETSVEPCLPSPLPLAYRNKIQLPIRIGSDEFALGLYSRSSHDLVEIDACFIHCELGEEVFQAVQPLLKQERPLLRHLLIKSALQTKQSLVILVGKKRPTPPLFQLAQKILKAHPSIQGVVYNLQSGPENVILGPIYHTLAGSDTIQERLSDLTFQISAGSFFQVNPLQAERLYAKALDFAQPTGEETVLDAYCGVGTLSLFFARKVKQVFGVECVPQAIENAKKNGEMNGISNARFVCATSEESVAKLPPIDIALLNPPRKGCDPAFLNGIARLFPKKIIYISCDPATLARDLDHLHSCGYKVERIQPFDMFPQTAHVECVALLTASKKLS
jgi:23S rRNA (uracil1939-C5)-methyltransferase